MLLRDLVGLGIALQAIVIGWRLALLWERESTVVKAVWPYTQRARTAGSGLFAPRLQVVG